MSKYTSPLDEVRVAAPCPADWGKMVGDERVRYCGSCSLHVYNLSGMTKREAEVLVTSTEGRMCVRFYRRGDGTILTRNCPVGLSAVKRRVTRVAGSVLSAVVAFFAGLGLNLGLGRTEPRYAVMGAMAMPAERGYKLDVAPAEDFDQPVVVQGAITVEVPEDAGQWVEGRMARPNYTPRKHVRRHARRGR
jgi:hypothetical protein